MSCRICHDDEDTDNLFIPCDCKGSMLHVHRSCISKWINHSKRGEKCDTCGYYYNYSYTRASAMFYLFNMALPVLSLYLLLYCHRSETLEKSLIALHEDIEDICRTMACYIYYTILFITFMIITHPCVWVPSIMICVYDRSYLINCIVISVIFSAWTRTVQKILTDSRGLVRTIHGRDKPVSMVTRYLPRVSLLVTDVLYVYPNAFIVFIPVWLTINMVQYMTKLYNRWMNR